MGFTVDFAVEYYPSFGLWIGYSRHEKEIGIAIPGYIIAIAFNKKQGE